MIRHARSILDCASRAWKALSRARACRLEPNGEVIAKLNEPWLTLLTAGVCRQGQVEGTATQLRSRLSVQAASEISAAW
jgi:hypothetical protein